MKKILEMDIFISKIKLIKTVQLNSGTVKIKTKDIKRLNIHQYRGWFILFLYEMNVHVVIQEIQQLLHSKK